MGPHHHIEKLLDHGPGKGVDALRHSQLLEQAFDLMKSDASLPFGDALAQVDVDLSSVPTPVLRDIVQNQPPEVQQQVAHWASSGDAAGNANALRTVGDGGIATPAQGSTATGAVSGASTNNGIGPTGTPPGNAYGHSSSAPALDPGMRLLPAVAHSPVLQAATNAPSQWIQRIFNGEGARVESAQNQSAIPRTAGGDGLRTETTQAVAMPRNANGEAFRAERAQQDPVSNNIQQRQDPVRNPANLVHSRTDGRAPSAQQATTIHGNAGAQQTAAQHAVAQASPQGAAQAAGFSAQQAAAQVAPQHSGARQMGEQAGQQLLNPRAADAAAGNQRVAEAHPTLAAADARGLTPQQQLPSQAVLPAQARPEVMAAQVLPQLAGLTVVANPQIPAINTQLNQNATPAASGAENSASQQSRDALLAPAGHTLAGFLRRDHRGRGQALRKPVDWVLALMTGARNRRAENEPEATSFQWLFWILTVATYCAIATALVAMIPNGGSLLDDRGHPSAGAYALAVGAIAAIASWLVGRRLAARQP